MPTKPVGQRKAEGRFRHTQPLAIAEMASLRSAAYRLFAALLLRPELSRLRWLRSMADSFHAHSGELATFGFFRPWQRLLRVLKEIKDENVAALEREHIRLFASDPAGVPCFPNESCYVVRGGQDAGWVTAQVAQTYTRAGLSLAPSLNENPDHAAVELEFMAYLCRQETEAWEGQAPGDARRALGQQHSFLQLHLNRWFGDFAREVRASTTERFYVSAVDAADAFVHHDLDLVKALMTEIRGLSAKAASPRPQPPVTSGQTSGPPRDLPPSASSLGRRRGGSARHLSR